MDQSHLIRHQNSRRWWNWLLY